MSYSPEMGIVLCFSCLHFYRLSTMQNPSQDKAKRTLTGREKEVIEYLSMGLTYDEIATQLNVSPETVKMHLKNIYRKLQVKNKIEALNKMKLL